MEAASLESELKRVAAQEAETLYFGMLSRKWDSLHRRSGISVLSSYGTLATLAFGGLAIAAAAAWPHAVPPQTIPAAVAGALFGLILFQGCNGYFAALERHAFDEIARCVDPRLAAPAPARKGRKPGGSPFYPFAKLAAKPRVRAKEAWVEKRMRDFLARRELNERQAEIFEKQRVKLGSIHGAGRSFTHAAHA
jgi:hypothetical protein